MGRATAAAPRTDPAFHAALQWVARLNDEAVSESDRTRFTRWMTADPSHPPAFERAVRLWDCFDAVKPAADRMRRRRAVLGTLAAAMAAPVLYGLCRQLWAADYRSGVGERRSLALEDGSRIELSTDSAISVAFSATARRVTLLRGQAFFAVAPDPKRPFSVQTASGVTTALGTQFDIRRDADAVTVSVLEHAVRIHVPGKPDPAPVRQGWQIRYDDNGAQTPVRMDPSAVTAWRQDRVVFDDVPLKLVLRELARYRHGPIVLMDREAGALPVTAVFNTRDIAAALHGLADAFALRVLDVGGYAAFVYADR